MSIRYPYFLSLATSKYTCILARDTFSSNNHRLKYEIELVTYQNPLIIKKFAQFQDTGTNTIEQKDVFLGPPLLEG